MNVVIYARFSSHAQNEQSIEGQLKVCYEYAKAHGYTVVGEYIDRALTATTDRRPNFLRMIEDSRRGTFNYILVYQLDRFARNRYDSATYKAKLKKNGVRVLSARENISDDASGILMESVLEGMAEYFSAELSQKIRRGMALSAEKGRFLGSFPAFGYKVSADKKFVIDEETAPVVQKIFEMYASGLPVREITAYLNERHILTQRGKPFSKNSLQYLLRNKKYTGVYTFKGKETAEQVPRIVSDQLFNEVQARMKKHTPSSVRADEKFLLTTKLFCGHCREMMTGSSGTSKTGEKHYYYVCKKARKKECDKKPVRKKWIEDIVVNKCREILTDENIESIVRICVDMNKKNDAAAQIRRLEKLIKENERAIDNLFKAIEAGAPAEPIVARIQEKNAERAELDEQLSAARFDSVTLVPSEVRFFLRGLRCGAADDEKSRQALITAFVNAVYLYDDKITLVLNAAGKTEAIDVDLLDEIEANTPICSPVNNIGVPKAPIAGAFSHSSDYSRENKRTR